MDISKKEHFSRLNQTTAVVWPVIESLVQNALSKHDADYLRPHLEVFLQKRRGKPLLRPYLARVAYESAGGTSWEAMGKLFAAAELLNISTYQSNMCFDEKYDEWMTTSANNQFISSMLTLSLAIQAVNAQESICEASKVAATELIMQVNSEVYMGQFIDLNELSLKHIARYLSAEPSVFANEYLKRCRLIGASMFRLACIGAYAVTPAPVHESALCRYFDCLGVAGQILNDLADYMPDANRPYASQYDDLRMGRLTLPTYILARDKHPVIACTWDTTDNYQKCLESATAHLLIIGAGARCRELLNNECWQPLSEALRDISILIPEDLLRPFTFARHYIFESRMLRYFLNAGNQARSYGGK